VDEQSCAVSMFVYKVVHGSVPCVMRIPLLQDVKQSEKVGGWKWTLPVCVTDMVW
jgi:hypothetical protein